MFVGYEWIIPAVNLMQKRKLKKISHVMCVNFCLVLDLINFQLVCCNVRMFCKDIQNLKTLQVGMAMSKEEGEGA